MTDALFDLPDGAHRPHTPADTGAQISAGRRLTLRQLADLARGRHPLTRGPLHPEAAPPLERTAPGRRCGNCWHRGPGPGGHAGTFPKCWYGYEAPTDTQRYAYAPRITGGLATDCRAWWPGCTDHTYGDPALSRDAARHVPTEAAP